MLIVFWWVLFFDCLLWCCFLVCGKIVFLDSFEEFNLRLVIVLVVGFVILIFVLSLKFFFVLWVVEIVFFNECWFFFFKDCCLDIECFVLLLIFLVSLFCLSLFNICWIVWKFGLSSFDIGFLVLLLLFSWGVCFCFNLLMKVVFFGVGGIFLVIIFSGVVLLFCGCERIDILLLLFVVLVELLGIGFFWIGGVIVCCVFVNVFLI